MASIPQLTVLDAAVFFPGRTDVRLSIALIGGEYPLRGVEMAHVLISSFQMSFLDVDTRDHLNWDTNVSGPENSSDKTPIPHSHITGHTPLDVNEHNNNSGNNTNNTINSNRTLHARLMKDLKQAYPDSVLHVPRTLDQSYYEEAASLDDRNNHQVISRYMEKKYPDHDFQGNSSSANKDSPTVQMMMVPQLWLGRSTRVCYFV